MKVIFAGGGTGGHLLPGVSVAEHLASVHGGKILFLVTGKEMDSQLLRGRGFESVIIPQAAPPKKLMHLASFAARSSLALLECVKFFASWKPEVVVTLGGYGSVLPAVAAAIFHVPVVAMEQNALPGRATRLLSHWASCICLAFDESCRYFQNGAVVKVTGNPVRKEILRLGSGYSSKSQDRSLALHRFGLDENSKTILVLGGSQGASPINTAFAAAAQALGAWRDRLQFIHQTGTRDIESVRAAYERAGIRAATLPFIQEMALAYAVADLVISRAGATTISEICAVGLPSVLVPYPLARDDHQRHNARLVAENGAAIVVEQNDLTTEKVLEIAGLVWEDALLEEMRRKARILARPRALEAVAAEVMRLAH